MFPPKPMNAAPPPAMGAPMGGPAPGPAPSPIKDQLKAAIDKMPDDQIAAFADAIGSLGDALEPAEPAEPDDQGGMGAPDQGGDFGQAMRRPTTRLGQV